MPLEPWQTEYLETVQSFDHLPAEDARWLVSYFAFREPAPTDEMQQRAVRLLAGRDRGLRYFHLGVHVGRVHEGKRSRLAASQSPTGGQQPAPHDPLDPPFDPELTSFLGEAEGRAESAEVARRHRAAQRALLETITRIAESCQDANEARLLAEAYLTLPEPIEDRPQKG